MTRCIGINKKGKKCRYKIKEEGKHFCCDEHKPINKDILTEGCFMCCEKVDTKDLWILKCKHGFHYDCLNDWFLNLSENEPMECPICRYEYIQRKDKSKKGIDFSKIYEIKSVLTDLVN